MKSTFFILLALSSMSFAQEVKLGTFKIPLMIESETQGKFIEMSNEIAKRAGLKFNFIITPPKQTIGKFAKKETDCFFPALDVVLPGPVQKSETVYVKRDFLFMKGDVKKVSLKDLSSKKVGLTLGYPYAKEVTEQKNIKFDFAPSDELNVKKLLGGRIDYFIVEEKSGLKAIEQHGNGQINYDKSTPLSEQDVYFACQDKAITNKISQAIKSMQADGTFKKMFDN